MACIYFVRVPKVSAGENTESFSIVMYCMQNDKQPKKISIHNVGNGRLRITEPAFLYYFGLQIYACQNSALTKVLQIRLNLGIKTCSP